MTHDRSGTNEDLWDVVVIGAGVAGCVLARELARDGLRTLIVESKPFPRAKVCGACLNGLALSVLGQVGLMDAVLATGAVPVRQFEAMRRGRSVKIPLKQGLAVSRNVLDDVLAQAAVSAGATFCDHTTAVVAPAQASASFREVRLSTHDDESTVKARVVVVAAGLGRTCFGHDTVHRSHFAKNARLGAGCILSDAPACYRPEIIHMAIGKHGYLGIVRIEHGQLNIAGAFSPDFLKETGSPAAAAAQVLQEAGFAEIPDLITAKWIGTSPLTRRTRPLAADRLFLVGDAAGYVEPFTGEGMGWALASVMALKPIVISAVESWSPRQALQWDAAYVRAVGRRQGICRGLASILSRPIVSDIVFQAARIVPAVASRIQRRIDEPSPPALESMLRS